MSTKPDSKDRPRVELTYLHKKSHTEVKAGKVMVVEEQVKDGPKGISFKFYQKKDNKVTKVVGFQMNGKFTLKITRDGKNEPEKTGLGKTEVLKALSSMKDLEFATKYLSTAVKLGRIPTYHARVTGTTSRVGTVKRRSRKGSSKKRSSKKGSKKKSRKSRSRSRSRSKSSKRSSKKKSSKKKSRKGSRKKRRSRK
jgi:hypothetical protein